MGAVRFSGMPLSIIERNRKAQIAAHKVNQATVIMLVCADCQSQFKTTRDKAATKRCAVCHREHRRQISREAAAKRTPAEREAGRRREAERKGVPYKSRTQMSVEREAKRAAQAKLKVTRKALTLEERAERDRLKSRAYYTKNRAKVKARTSAWRKRVRLLRVTEFREMEQGCVKRWTMKNREKAREIKKACKAKRQARKRGATVETVYRRVVFERHRGVCGICLQPIDPAEQWHIDHVIPLSKGGAHSYANTQPSHPACNVRKGDKLPDDVAATGCHGSRAA
jgi:5-methylcytosine-specific restriction endonuclease McrA